MATPSRPHRRTRPRSDAFPLAALTLVVVFFVVSGWLALSNVRTIRANNEAVLRSQETVAALDEVLSSVQDAETGQRGYLLTSKDAYLEPYRVAVSVIPGRLDTIRAALGGDQGQLQRLNEMAARVKDKLDELAETVALRRSTGLEAALAVVNSDRGKGAMDDIRGRLAAMRAVEAEQRQQRVAGMEEAYRSALVSGGASAILGVALTLFVAMVLRRAARARDRDAWLQTGQLELSAALAGDQERHQLGKAIASFLARFLGAQVGAVFVPSNGRFSLIGGVGLASEESAMPARGPESLLGRAAEERQVLVIGDLPPGYLQVGSGLGQGEPRHLAIAPCVVDGRVEGVVELGFFAAVQPDAVTLLGQASAAIAVAMRSAAYRAQLTGLLEETQRQSDTLQTQAEELRVSNEELEEQSRALRESQQELESQQAELEQTNSYLSEQSSQLEAQRNALAQANDAIEAKADEVRRASQYKSQFLANMSHELRTPLNSALILSKLLQDNSSGNLTPEQVKFARTIHTSGNDLLTLINDILDLSKIEAGHIETHPEPIAIDGLLADLGAVFTPMADSKGLSFLTPIGSSTPSTLETDRQRLEQILRNLLSNAIKFTDAGTVSLETHSPTPETVAFTVTDTGIGIAADQQGRIFQAFQQADGSISRRYGGTGLGLSISQELAGLLGGDLTVTSKVGAGSTFVLTLPARLTSHSAPAAPILRAAPMTAPMSSPVTLVLPVEATQAQPEARRDPSERNILVIEDDTSFAEIVGELAREMGFSCLFATTAAEALTAAQEQVPAAIILDIGLPDQSGLSVLDILKHDVRTRHIPIHVVSAADHSRAALSLGAVGYLVKPASREHLVQVLATLEARVAQRPRRVLVVEDDQVQRDAVMQLLTSADVQAIGAASATECLALLAERTFDCMVLDLSLPDTSGLALLEALSIQETHSFPPVIVYTGRDLSPKEEDELRRYSHSIIIKGARSPERLLDEVTLFLHQVISSLPESQQGMIRVAQHRDAVLEGRHVLLVEDDVRNVFALMHVLEPQGVRVTIARNGQEAIDALSASPDAGKGCFDLVLMDIMMPVKDGLTAMREIRDDPRWLRLPIIALTAKAMPDDQQACLKAGASDYIAKPLDVDRLLSLMRVWVTAS